MFPIYYNNEICGHAAIEKEGLYLRIICKCDIPTERPCKVILESGQISIPLGTCIKVNNQYIINTRVPRKHIKSEGLRFRMQTNCEDAPESFMTVSENTPFPYLHKLHKARMCYKFGQVGVFLKE